MKWCHSMCWGGWIHVWGILYWTFEDNVQICKFWAHFVKCHTMLWHTQVDGLAWILQPSPQRNFLKLWTLASPYLFGGLVLRIEIQSWEWLKCLWRDCCVDCLFGGNSEEFQLKSATTRCLVLTKWCCINGLLHCMAYCHWLCLKYVFKVMDMSAILLWVDSLWGSVKDKIYMTWMGGNECPRVSQEEV